MLTCGRTRAEVSLVSIIVRCVVCVGGGESLEAFRCRAKTRRPGVRATIRALASLAPSSYLHPCLLLCVVRVRAVAMVLRNDPSAPRSCCFLFPVRALGRRIGGASRKRVLGQKGENAGGLCIRSRYTFPAGNVHSTMLSLDLSGFYPPLMISY